MTTTINDASVLKIVEIVDGQEVDITPPAETPILQAEEPVKAVKTKGGPDGKNKA